MKAFGGFERMLAIWAEMELMRNDVIFTTIAKDVTEAAATPTGVGREEI